MNTDIYCEIDRRLATVVSIFRKEFALNIQHIDMKGHSKWLKRTEKWRKKCIDRMMFKRWSFDKECYVASTRK